MISIPVPGYEKNYLVDTLGRVWSIKNKKFLDGGYSGSNYRFVSLCKDGDVKQVYVHKIVALAFLGERPLKHDINHINGIKSDNRPVNLEYLSRSENQKHGFRIGLHDKTRRKASERMKHWNKYGVMP